MAQDTRHDKTQQGTSTRHKTQDTRHNHGSDATTTAGTKMAMTTPTMTTKWYLRIGSFGRQHVHDGLDQVGPVDHIQSFLVHIISKQQVCFLMVGLDILAQVFEHILRDQVLERAPYRAKLQVRRRCEILRFHECGHQRNHGLVDALWQLAHDREGVEWRDHCSIPLCAVAHVTHEQGKDVVEAAHKL